MLKDFVAQLCVEMEIDPVPKINELKFIPLRFSEGLELEIRDLDPGISLHAKICPCPSKRLEELFLRLMRANYLGQETAQNRIGLSADEKFLPMSLGVPYEITYRIDNVLVPLVIVPVGFEKKNQGAQVLKMF